VRTLDVSRNPHGLFIKLGMRIALGSKAEKGGNQTNRMQRFGARHHGSNARFDRLDREGSKMLVEPGAPNKLRMRAWLQKTPHALGGAAAEKPERAAMRGSLCSDNDARPPVMARANEKPFVPPLHAGISPLIGCLLQFAR